MSQLACYWPWLLGGAAIGWVLWQLFDRMFRRDGEAAGVRLSRDLDGAKAQVSTLHADLSGANTRLSSLNAELSTGAAALKAKSDEALRLRGELTEWMNKHAELESRGQAAGVAAAAAAAVAATAATAASASLKAAHDKHDALKAEFDGAFRSLNLKTEELTRASAETAEWKAKHSATEKAAIAEIADWRSKHTSVDTDAKKVAAELAEWRTKHSTTAAEAEKAAAELADWRAKHAHVDAQHKASASELAEWRSKHTSLDAQHRATASELAEWRERHSVVDTQVKSTAAQLASSTSSASAAALAAAATLAALQAKFDALRAELDAAKGSVSARTGDVTRLQAELADWKSRYGTAESREKQLSGELQSSKAAASTAAAAAAASLTTANDRYTGLKRDHDTLIATLKSDHERATRSLNTDLDAARGQLRSRGDDVTRLNAELADWKARFASLESQSRASLLSANTVALAASLGYKPQKGGRDDLTIVEGIGPKINQLLIAGGIDTFVKLANAPVERVQAILDAAGPSFRLAKPASWAQQADLCARSDWEALRKLQDELTAGVDTDNKA